MKKLIIFLLTALSIAAFGQTTDATLTTQAQQIKNETVAGANTANRVGTHLQNLVYAKKSFFSDGTASGADTYSVTLDNGAITSLTNQWLVIKFTNGNTGAATLNPNAIGAKALVKTDGTALSSGDIDAGSIHILAYDGTNLQVLTVGGSGGAGTPGGSTTQVQFNNAGAFDGITGATTNGTVMTLTSPVFITPALGTPASGVGTNITGIVGTNVTNTPAGNIAATTAQAAINELDVEKAFLYPGVNNETANYNAALTDAGNFIEMESASPLTMTVLQQSSITWLANTELTVVNYGSADITLTPGSGVTFRNMLGSLLTVPQYGVAVIKRKASDEWYVFSRTASSNLASGTYTPTLTNTTNVAASTAFINNYMRVGSTVTVSGHVSIDPTSTGSTVLGMTLPVASAFGTVDQCGGTAASTGVAGIAIGILSDATNDRATFQYIAVDTTNQTFYFTFTYTVL